jgi:predicted O-methyltransferase YrrM
MSKIQLFPTVAQLTATVASKSKLPEFVDLQGWNSDHKIFDELVEDVQPKVIVEVGTWKGRSAWHFAEASQRFGSEIYCVDTWLGGIDHFLSDKPQDDLHRDEHGTPQIYEQFLRNFRDHHAAGRIHPVRQTSVNGARALASRGLFADLIYIDGSHEYEDAYTDICAYAPLVAPNGRIFGDDYASFPGVQIAVHRYAIEFNRRVKVVDGNFWILS